MMVIIKNKLEGKKAERYQLEFMAFQIPLKYSIPGSTRSTILLLLNNQKDVCHLTSNQQRTHFEDLMYVPIFSLTLPPSFLIFLNKFIYFKDFCYYQRNNILGTQGQLAVSTDTTESSTSLMLIQGSLERFGDNFRFLWLVRDVRGFVSSWMNWNNASIGLYPELLFSIIIIIIFQLGGRILVNVEKLVFQGFLDGISTQANLGRTKM